MFLSTADRTALTIGHSIFSFTLFNKLWSCRYLCRYSNIEEPTRCNNNNLSISKFSSTCFGKSFAHLQERKTEIFTACGIVSCCCGRQGFGEQLPSYSTHSATLPLSDPLPTTTTGRYTICCKNLSLTLLKMCKRLPEKCWADLGDQ